MSQPIRQASRFASPASVFGHLLERAGLLVSKVQQHRRLAYNRRILSELSDEQLKDAGIEREMILPPRPTMEVEAGLMRKLLSMR